MRWGVGKGVDDSVPGLRVETGEALRSEDDDSQLARDRHCFWVLRKRFDHAAIRSRYRTCRRAPRISEDLSGSRNLTSFLLSNLDPPH